MNRYIKAWNMFGIVVLICFFLYMMGVGANLAPLIKSDCQYQCLLSKRKKVIKHAASITEKMKHINPMIERAKAKSLLHEFIDDFKKIKYYTNAMYENHDLYDSKNKYKDCPDYYGEYKPILRDISKDTSLRSVKKALRMYQKALTIHGLDLVKLVKAQHKMGKHSHKLFCNLHKQKQVLEIYIKYVNEALKCQKRFSKTY